MALPREVGFQPASITAVTALRTRSVLTNCFSVSGRPFGRSGGGLNGELGFLGKHGGHRDGRVACDPGRLWLTGGEKS